MSFQRRAGAAGLGGAVGRARDQLAKAIACLDRADDRDRDSIIHEVRKRIKRSRALIRLARGVVGRKAVARVDRRLREAARPLSAVRDAAVLIETLDALDDRSGELAPGVDIASVRGELEAHRDRVAFERLEEGDALDRASKLLRSARRRLRKWDVDGLASRPISAYRRDYRRGRVAFEDASAEPSAVRLHRLRKRAKALGCQLGSVEADPSGPVARLQRLANLLADELGEVHDLDILREFLEGLEPSSPILGPLDRRRLALRHDALQRAGVVFLDKPRAFAEMIEAAMEPGERTPPED